MQSTACVASDALGSVRPVRVGYCIDSFEIGGTELNAVRTVEALDRQRFQVTVFHLHETGPLRARYEALGLQLLHLPIGRLYSPRTASRSFTRTISTATSLPPPGRGWLAVASLRVAAGWMRSRDRVSCRSIVGAIVTRTGCSSIAPWSRG